MHILSIGVKKNTLFLEHVYSVGVSINESIQMNATYGSSISKAQYYNRTICQMHII